MKRKKWWQVEYGYSSSVSFYHSLTVASSIVGMVVGLKYWIFDFGRIGLEDVIFPLAVIIAVFCFMRYRHFAKKEYEEKDLGNPRIWEK